MFQYDYMNSTDSVDFERNKKSKLIHHNELKEDGDDHDEPPPGLTSNLNHFYDDESETDNISEITPPKRSKFDLLVPLFKRLFHQHRSVENVVESEESQTVIKEKTQILKYNASTSKIHPSGFKNVKNVHYDETRYHYLTQCLYSVAELMNTRDKKGLEAVIQDIFLEDCIFKSPALKQHVIGREHVQEYFRSIMRVSDNIHSKIRKCEEEEIGDSIVISSHYTITGTLAKYHNNTVTLYYLFKI